VVYAQFADYKTAFSNTEKVCQDPYIRSLLRLIHDAQ